MPELDPIQFIFRWIHFLAGITWIGLLYFFNLVNAPFQRVLDAGAKPKVIPELMPRALAWFRHAAWVTVLAGFVLIYHMFWRDGDLFNTNSDKTIFVGMILGVIMMLNVWLFIWPNQRKIIAATRAGESVDPKWGQTATFFSRTNFTLSFPLLLFMGGSSHFPMDWGQIVLYGIIAGVIGWAIVLYVQKWGVSRF